MAVVCVELKWELSGVKEQGSEAKTKTKRKRERRKKKAKWLKASGFNNGALCGTRTKYVLACCLAGAWGLAACQIERVRCQSLLIWPEFAA